MALGGVGEAALLGAAMGGGAAALTGGDPLKGALLGGLTGGAGAGIGGALGGAAPTALTGVTGAGSTLGAGIGSTLGAEAGALGAGLAPTASSFSALGAQGANLGSLSAFAPTASAGIPSVLPSASSALGSSLAPTASNFSALSSGAAPNLASMSGGVSGSLPNAVTAAGPQTFGEGMARFANDPMASVMRNKFTAGASALAGLRGGMEDPEGPEEYNGPLKRFRFNPETYRASPFAEGGIAALGAEGYDRMVGEQPMYQAMASGGISNLGSYSDGGRMLKGPGDGMSDSIPGVIGGKRPARLADGEFVVPADVVSHLGNGSTDAGAKQLYSMMDKVRTARTGSKKQGREINPRKYALA